MTTIIKKGQIDRAIWGNRLYDEQTGVMTFLEFLCVLQSKSFAQQNPDRRIELDRMKLGEYEIPKRSVLRTLVFNNPYIDEIYADAEDPWDEWFDSFSNDEQNVKFDSSGSCKMLELKERLLRLFCGDSDDSRRKGFENFAKIIRLLRFSGINVMSDKRWTSRFVFPWGKHCLFADLKHDGTIDRRFFGRNGELLFLLLSFAERRDELGELIRQKILDSGHPLDRLCSAMQSDNFCIHVQGGASLPEFFGKEDLRRVNILCEDLIHLFQLPIPVADIINFASTIITLNLFCYYMECSYRSLTKCGASLPFKKNVYLCEVIQKAGTAVRRISKEFFNFNNKQSSNAVRAYYESKLGKEPQSDAIDEDDEELELSADIAEERSDSLAQVLSTHGEHWANIHRVFAKDCGLGSRLCTNAYRYAPTDALLEALVSTLVTGKRLLFSEFLSLMYERYGLVFGEVEFQRAEIHASNYIADSSELKSNRRRLQNRIDALGLLVSLSDGFEFVLNPYRA